MYEQRQFIVEGLNRIPGIMAVKPRAAFYIFPHIDMNRFNFQTDEDFVLRFLREKHILLTQGTGFNWKTSEHFRLVFLPEIEQLQHVITSLTEFLENHTKRMAG